MWPGLTMEVYRPEKEVSGTMRCNGGRHSAKCRSVTARGVIATASSKFGGRVVSTLDGPIWSKYSMALTYSAKSHFQRTLNKKRWVQGWDELDRLSRKKEQ